MIVAGIIGAVYLAQLGAKAWLAGRYARSAQCADEMVAADDRDVTIVQPILGGDPNLGATLEATVNRLKTARFLWLVDEDDAEGAAVCERLVAARADGRVTILRCGAHAQGENPKAHKLVLALPQIETAVFVVLDDDTRLTAAGLRALKAGLASGAALATGLPRYHAAEGAWSGWLARSPSGAAASTCWLTVPRPSRRRTCCRWTPRSGTASWPSTCAGPSCSCARPRRCCAPAAARSSTSWT